MDINRKLTIKECEDFMHNKADFQNTIINMRKIYESWDHINDHDEIMLDHLQEVLHFFGVKKLAGKCLLHFESLIEIDKQHEKIMEAHPLTEAQKASPF